MCVRLSIQENNTISSVERQNPGTPAQGAASPLNALPQSQDFKRCLKTVMDLPSWMCFGWAFHGRGHMMRRHAHQMVTVTLQGGPVMSTLVPIIGPRLEGS
jgi:hypothetical protein